MDSYNNISNSFALGGSSNTTTNLSYTIPDDPLVTPLYEAMYPTISNTTSETEALFKPFANPGSQLPVISQYQSSTQLYPYYSTNNNGGSSLLFPVPELETPPSQNVRLFPISSLPLPTVNTIAPPSINQMLVAAAAEIAHASNMNQMMANASVAGTPSARVLHKATAAAVQAPSNLFQQQAQISNMPYYRNNDNYYNKQTLYNPNYLSLYYSNNYRVGSSSTALAAAAAPAPAPALSINQLLNSSDLRMNERFDPSKFSKERVYKCDLCCVQFPTAQALGGHMSYHSKAKKNKREPLTPPFAVPILKKPRFKPVKVDERNEIAKNVAKNPNSNFP